MNSQFTRAIRGLAERFEHRLFLSATPHNGHSNSFSSLLEILDPQRFTRGFPVEPAELEPVMVRRLKSDLIKLNVSKFPNRRIEPIILSDLPEDAPELVLSSLLDDYREWCETGLQGTPLANARFVLSGLQQRLLSSVPAFSRSLRKHLETLKRQRDRADQSAPQTAASLMADTPVELETDESADEGSLLDLIQKQEEDVAEAATASVKLTTRGFDEAIARVEVMLAIARRNERRPDERVRWLIDWIEKNMMASPGRWNRRRLIIFTEWEDTRLWLEKRLNEAFADTDLGPNRIATFTGITGQKRREEVKLAFNADPEKAPLRLLLCTDAAREGINLQTRCHDLIHFDLPWNPSRLEQRNGRIDRKLQPADTVTCRYFVYAQRAEDQVLSALVRKTETIRSQLGSSGQVLAERIHGRLTSGGISRRSAAMLAREIEEDIREEDLTPARQTAVDTLSVAELVTTDTDDPVLPDPWLFFERILGWEARYVAGAPGGPSLPEDIASYISEHEVLLSPNWAVRDLGGADQGAFQILVKLHTTLDADKRGVLDRWDATPHHQFERLLRESGVTIGVLVDQAHLRLIYAPRGETSGWLSFPLRSLGTVAGRAMLGGLKLILGHARLFTEPEGRRLPKLLARSREAQNKVSAQLAEQVLGALHELLRAFHVADPERIEQLVATRPHHLYEGLLTTLMRLVFLLYAEDRELLPTQRVGEACVCPYR